MAKRKNILKMILRKTKSKRGAAEQRAMFAKMGASGSLQAKGPGGKRTGKPEPKKGEDFSGKPPGADDIENYIRNPKNKSEIMEWGATPGKAARAALVNEVKGRTTERAQKRQAKINDLKKQAQEYHWRAFESDGATADKWRARKSEILQQVAALETQQRLDTDRTNRYLATMTPARLSSMMGD